MAKEKINPFLFRYPPNTRFSVGAFSKQNLVTLKPINFGDSVTDKESYRLSLVGKTGSITSLGQSQQGWYMFPDGKYSLDKDFSHVMRKDLSIVEIDDYIKNMAEAQKSADKHLQVEIEKQLQKAYEAKKNLESKSDDNGGNSSE